MVMICDSCARTVQDPCEAERVSGLCLVCLSGTPPDPASNRHTPPPCPLIRDDMLTWEHVAWALTVVDLLA
jgi:hypothetical protein